MSSYTAECDLYRGASAGGRAARLSQGHVPELPSP